MPKHDNDYLYSSPPVDKKTQTTTKSENVQNAGPPRNHTLDMVIKYCNIDGSAMWSKDRLDEEPFMTNRLLMWKNI